MAKNTDLKVFQSNKMTLATYNFTANQKNIVYKILVAIKDNLVQENLFGDKVIYLEKKLLLKYRQDVKRLKADLDRINQCTIHFTREDGAYVIAGVINNSVIEPRVSQVEIVVNKEFIKFVRHCYKEFTAYNLTVILSLKGAHAKRLYEICCMGKGLGKYTFSLLELKKMLCVENKYKLQKDFERFLIEPAQKRINECEAAEVSFDYKFEKKNREVFVILKIKDKKKEAEKLKNLKASGTLTPKQKMNQAAIYLGERFGKKHKYYEIFNVLKAKGQIADFVVKYREKLNYYEKKGKSDEEFQKIITKILKEDFGIDLKDYRKEGVGIKKRPKPKTLRGQISFLTK